MASRLLSPRFSKSRLIDELLEFSNKIAKAVGVRLDRGTSECRPKRNELTLKQPSPNNTEVYRLTSRELDDVISKAVEYGRATACQNLATWIDDGRFGVTGINKEQDK